MKRILFLLKARLYSHARTSYGLINSSNHIARFLERHHYDCRVKEVVDANCIDKEVYAFKPDIVVIEALWVPTYKMQELLNLRRYRHITWIERVHSDIAYLSAETQALKLVNEYIHLWDKRLVVSLNNHGFTKSLSGALNFDLTYLPNIINMRQHDSRDTEDNYHMHVGCFGATRLLKNQCFQAICAISAADTLNKKLYFHVTPNLGMENDPVLTNLQELFKNGIHELVVHDWLPNHEFQELIRRMDFGLQISHTESFNIVSADFINNNKLILVSDAIKWMPDRLKTSTVDYEEATKKIIFAYKRRNSVWLKELSRQRLADFNELAERIWLSFLRHGDN